LLTRYGSIKAMLADTFPDEIAAAEERIMNELAADWQSRKKGSLSDSTPFYFSSPFLKGTYLLRKLI